jgi:hypothetical protein
MQLPLSSTLTFTPSVRIMEAGDLTVRKNSYLACVRPWVQYSTSKINKNSDRG